MDNGIFGKMVVAGLRQSFVMKKNSGIYCIRNVFDGKRYIGWASDITKRWKSHEKDLIKNNHCNIPLQHAWNKYGKENFKFEIMLMFFGNEYLLKILEKIFIFIFKSHISKGRGYNLTFGGDGSSGFKHSEETKKLLSQQHTGMKYSDETKHKQSIMRKGKNNGNYGRGLFGKDNPMFGKHRTEKDKIATRKAHIGTKRKNSPSIFYGVRPSNRKKNPWRVQITDMAKAIHIGNYRTEIEAALTYNAYVIKNKLDRPLNIIK
jgi:group I intron endonuclease